MADELNLPTMEVRPDSANFVDKPPVALSDIRKQFPMYADVPDDKLLIGLHKTYYSDIPAAQFFSRIKYDTNKPDPSTGGGTALGMNTPEWLDRGLAGAGKSVADTATGIKQLFGQVPQSDIDETKAQDKPLMSTTAGVLGNVGGAIGQMAVPGAALGKVAPAVNALGKAAPLVSAGLNGAGFSGLQPVSDGESRGTNALMGGAAGMLGQGIASGVSRIAKGASDLIDPATKALYEKAQAMGIPVSGAQLSDSKFVKYLQDALSKLPMSGAKDQAATQQGAFNRAVSNTFGEDSPTVDSALYSKAKGRIGGVFNDLTSRNDLTPTPQMANALGQVSSDATKFGTSDTARSVANAIDEIMSKADPQTGQIPGQAYQSFDSAMGKLTRGGDEKAHYIGQIRDAVRSAMDSSIGPADQAAWQGARSQYAALKTIRDLVAKDTDGNINPNLLMGRVTATGAGKERMAQGNGGDLGDLAQIGKKLFYSPPDSGTGMRNLIYGGLLGGGAYGAHEAGASPGQIGLGAAGVLGGAAAGRVLGAVLRSPVTGRYLANGTGPVGNALAIPAQALPLALPGYLNVR